MGRRTGATASGTASAVSDVGLMIFAVEVGSVPASSSVSRDREREVCTDAGKMMVCRIILQEGSAGISTVSWPVQGAPPMNVFSSEAVQQRWQMLVASTEPGLVLTALPVSMRNP